MTSLGYGPFLSRKQAQEQGLTQYFTGKPCKNGHISPRKAGSCNCMTCHNEKSREHYVENSNYYKEKSRKWSENNPAQKSKTRKDWNKRNKNHMEDLRARWMQENYEKKAETNKRWEAAHPWMANIRSANRRANRRSASVPLTKIEKMQIKAIYQLRRTLSMVTGIEHHVDHRFPISKGGKHHPANLWVITAKENRRKNARIPEEFVAAVS